MSTEYAILDRDAQGTLFVARTAFFDVLPTHKPGMIRPIVNANPPTGPGPTEVLYIVGYTIDDTQVVRTLAVRAMTAEELAAKNDDTERQQLIAIYNDLKNGVGTAGERITRVERVLAWVLKRYANGSL